MAAEDRVDLVAAAALVPAGLIALVLQRADACLDIVEFRLRVVETLAERFSVDVGRDAVE